jgi:N-acetylmuramoyl-L-alanine amidase
VDDYFRNAPPPGSLFARQGNRDNAQAANYVVNRGDTLSAIAASHGVSIAQLRDANQLADERVRAGEVLRIPSG